MESINLIYDHYKETLGFIKDSEKSRNSQFIYLLILITFFLLIVFEPLSTYNIFLKLLETKFGVNIEYSCNVIKILILFLILFVLTKYYQINVYIERQYIYLAKCENKLKEIDENIFSRECQEYNGQYPKILSATYYFYKFIFPVFLMILMGTNLLIEVINFNNKGFIFIDFIIAVIIIVLSWQYLKFNIEIQENYNN